MIGFLAALIRDRRLAFAVTAAVAVIAGSVAPWAHIASPLRPVSEIGLDSDGKLTIFCGLLALGLLISFAQLQHRDLAAAAAIAGLAAAGLAVRYDIEIRRASARVMARLLDVGGAATADGFGVRAAAGLWLTIVSALTLAGAAGWIAVRSQNRSNNRSHNAAGEGLATDESDSKTELGDGPGRVSKTFTES